MPLFSLMELPKAAYSEDDQGVACVTLWRCVLDRFLDDATYPEEAIKTKSRAVLKQQALEWLADSEGFREVCYLAMLDHKWAFDQVNNYVQAQRDTNRSVQREGAGSGSGPAQRGDNPPPSNAGL